VDYVRLTKPRSVLLLLVAALAGMVVARPEVPPVHLILETLLAGALAAGGANALNCYLDRDLDRQMRRTTGRPLPSGKLLPGRALLFGLTLSAVSVTIFALGVNWLSAALAACGIFYYVVVYTLWLKRASHWNVVIGGQLFSKSLRGLTVYKLELLGVEGFFMSALLLLLPFVILYVLIVVLPPWPDREAKLEAAEALPTPK